MSPAPTLERIGPAPVGPCIARDDHGPDDRVQVTVVYRLTGVPGREAQKLVRQPDDFWMDAMTGVVDRAKGEGLASIKVTSPCFLPPGKSSASTAVDPAALEEPQADDPARRRALGHSSRVYDVLRAGSAPTRPGEGLSTVRDESGSSVHLLECMRRMNHLTVQVMSSDQHAHAGSNGPMRLMCTAEGPNPVFGESQGGDRLISKPEQGGDMCDLFGILRAQALTPWESAEIIGTKARQL
ncbi:Scr1 family TA system antitoxin-like transcriptional regulator [Streptomyces sp. CLV115]|uniref:Scr1 family TA system antitoxin-like transcriptional regulator n=1 Tax=Streptomyces sp. CLV115 TaxID=3138502 RepID=UPI00313CCE78